MNYYREKKLTPRLHKRECQSIVNNSCSWYIQCYSFFYWIWSCCVDNEHFISKHLFFVPCIKEHNLGATLAKTMPMIIIFHAINNISIYTSIMKQCDKVFPKLKCQGCKASRREKCYRNDSSHRDVLWLWIPDKTRNRPAYLDVETSNTAFSWFFEMLIDIIILSFGALNLRVRLIGKKWRRTRILH